MESREGCHVFHFTGQLDAYSEKQFLDFVREGLEGESSPVIVDLSKIDFIDSSGLGSLVQVARQCSEAGVRFLVVGNARVVQTVKLVRLESFLHLKDDLASALQDLAA
ncbi:anti-sigma factor antagonist [Synechococcus sp. RSCCF101]|nr:anti-sigma factor antagonist [Synechococcus sp. RSCCF101]